MSGTTWSSRLHGNGGSENNPGETDLSKEVDLELKIIAKETTVDDDSGQGGKSAVA